MLLSKGNEQISAILKILYTNQKFPSFSGKKIFFLTWLKETIFYPNVGKTQQANKSANQRHQSFSICEAVLFFHIFCFFLHSTSLFFILFVLSILMVLGNSL